MKDPGPALDQFVSEAHRVQSRFFAEHRTAILDLVDLVAGRFNDGCKLLLFGNGGSAADAQHIAAEFVGRFMPDRPALPALSLSTDTSVLTALGNDYGYERIFARQIEALGRAGDVAVGISTSGSSPNVLAGLEAARMAGLYTVGLTGESGGRMPDRVNVIFRVPSRVTPRIQETHILLGHILCELVDRRLFPGSYDE
jgi:D-sedoheptulose 7-phosphate isomerase